jgi:hypothetical protein
VPVKVASEWDTGEVGNVQVDYVAHCGRSTGGEYVHTLSAVDIASGWWEGQAIPGRSQRATEEGLKQIRARCPFRILEIHPDNDSGLINDLLWRYRRGARIQMSRSRPYQKNDNAWVEQKKRKDSTPVRPAAHALRAAAGKRTDPQGQGTATSLRVLQPGRVTPAAE